VVLAYDKENILPWEEKEISANVNITLLGNEES
jgi:hypothetical protein